MGKAARPPFFMPPEDGQGRYRRRGRRRLSPPARPEGSREGGQVNDGAGEEMGQAGHALLRSLHSLTRTFAAAGVSPIADIVYWVPFPRAYGARRE